MRIKNGFVGSVHIATVANDAAGLKFIADLRQSIRQSKTKIKVQVYGRGHRFGKGRIRGSYVDGQFKATNWDNSYQSSLPRDRAERLAIYLS